MRAEPAPNLRASLMAMLDPVPTPHPGPGHRIAGVLAPLIDGARPSLVFTQRTDELPRHAGEISFPGGMADDDDPDIAGTALREMNEELGIDAAEVELLGALPAVHTFVSGILVVPFVGMLRGRPTFRPNMGEIAEVLEFPMADLASVEATVEWQRGERTYRGYAYEVQGHTIWGATARMLHDLLDVVRRTSPWVIDS
jgi:8-oxo-dGTP pyrophosphatase MutT (NUDIX family)